MAGRGKKNRTEADETGNRQGPGRPPGRPLTGEEEKIRKERKNQKDREDRTKKARKLEVCEAFCLQPENKDNFKAFGEGYWKTNGEGSSSKKDGTIADVDMLTGNVAGSSNVSSNFEGGLQSSTTWTMRSTAGALNSTAIGGVGTLFEPPVREEELAEACSGKMPATADNYPSPHLPIGGSRPSGFMANARQTAPQSALPCHSSWKVTQQNEELPKWINLPAQKQQATYVVKCPSSHGLNQAQFPQLDVPPGAVMPGMGSLVDPVNLDIHCWKRPPHDSCHNEVGNSEMWGPISDMQERLQRMEYNIAAQIQRSIVAALTQSGSCPQANAPIVSPAELRPDPLGIRGGNTAAGYSGGLMTQSSPPNEEDKLKEYNLYKAFCGEPGITDQFKAFSEKYRESLKFQLKEYKAFCEEPGIADMFKAYRNRNEFHKEIDMLGEDLKGTYEVSDWDALLDSLGHQASAEIFPEPDHHDPLGMPGGTNAAAGSSGGHTTQWLYHDSTFM